jgi:hypothetical protein
MGGIMHKTNQDLVKENTLLLLKVARLERKLKELETKPTEKIILGL